MKLRTLLWALIALPSLALAAGPQKSPIDRDITQLTELFGDGIAEGGADMRRVVYGKVFASARNDAVALFSIEGFHGGNYHAEYIAFFQGLEPELGRLEKPEVRASESGLRR